jgi:sigma-B regulation protein RsbU (phosphoserine phosphatase)
MNGVNTADVALQTLRGEVVDIVLGTIFLFIGATACAIAAIRWGRGVRILVWLGVFSGMYGIQKLIQPLVALAVLPHALKSATPYVGTAVMYLLLVSALFAWRELSLGKLRLLLLLEIYIGLAIALVGIVTFVFGGPDDKWMFYNNLLAVFSMLVLFIVVLVPRLSKFLVITNHRVLTAATLIFAIEVLYTNLSSVLHYRVLPLVDSIGFAALLFSLGYVALEILFTNERRLLSIETELETARQIQASILPSDVPKLSRMRISAAYCPMTAVAGDFYWFIATDPNRAGFLVADVSGHGVPAALIASMIKVAMQSVVSRADEPASVLREVERVLSGQLHGQFVSAAYLWLDTESRKALYSAAGHPPLLRWSQGKLESIESNGLIFGVLPECDYPVCEIAIATGDRFLLYTDGITEPENAKGESFGDRRLEEVVRESQLSTPSELSDRLLLELRQWQPSSAPQQDDITLIVIDVL